MEHKAWDKYLQAAFHLTQERMVNTDTSSSSSSSLLIDMENKLPSYTPKLPDNVVYARIESMQASNIEDVSLFLLKLKEDFRIGEPGLPEKGHNNR